jgi:hypothetical protein
VSRQGGINGCSQYPKLSNIDHDEHDQPCLPDGSMMTLGWALTHRSSV